jgi:hypothetical protein
MDELPAPASDLKSSTIWVNLFFPGQFAKGRDDGSRAGPFCGEFSLILDG